MFLDAVLDVVDKESADGDHPDIEMLKKREPVEATHLREEPTTLRSIIQAHLTELDYSVDDLGEIFGLLSNDVEALYPVPRAKPQLRLVN